MMAATEEVKPAIALTDEQLLMMSQRYRAVDGGEFFIPPAMVLLTESGLLELLRDVAGRGWRGTAVAHVIEPEEERTVENLLHQQVEELRQLTDALMVVGDYEDAQRVLAVLIVVDTLHTIDELNLIKWPLQLRTSPSGRRTLLRIDEADDGGRDG